MSQPGLLRRFGQRVARWVARRALSYAGVPLRDPALMELFGMRGRATSGVYVDETNALTLAAYYRAISLISSTIAMLRFECVVKSKGKGTVRAEGHLANDFFDIEPNQNMTWFQLAEMLTQYALTWGNGCAWIDRDKNGFPIAVWPLAPNQVTIELDPDGKKIFKFKKMYPGEVDETYDDYEILHICGFGFDGVKGCSLIHNARDSLGLGFATERFGAGFFGNNAVPGFIIEHPGSVKLEGKNRIIDEVEGIAGGTDRARTGVILDEGMKYKQIGIPPEDGQFLQTRQFQVREIARWTGVPPHMLFDLDNANFSTTEGQSLEFLSMTLAPWLQRWIQEMKRKLLAEQERASHTFRVDTSNLVMLDNKTKWDVYSQGRNLGYWTLNDIAEMQNDELLPAEVGNIRLTPSTMNPLISEAKPPAIDPDTVTGLMAVLGAMRGATSAQMRSVILTVIPTASDDFINTLTGQYNNAPSQVRPN